MPLIKIWNFDRSIRKAAVITNMQELLKSAKNKFGYDKNEKLKIYFENDGTELDTDEELQWLIAQSAFPETVLLIAPEMQKWIPPNSKACAVSHISSVSLSDSDASDSSSHSIFLPQPSTSPSSIEVSLNNFSSSHSIFLPQPSTSSSSIEVSLNNFVIPWEKFPKRFIKDCEHSLKPDPADRREVVRQIVNAVMDISINPPRKFLEKIAIEMTSKYPDSLANTIGTKRHESLFIQIENRLHHCNRPRKLKATRVALSDDSFPSGLQKIKAQYGCIQWQPQYYPVNETIVSQGERKDWLKKQNELNIDNDDVTNNMNLTYVSQRLDINRKTFSIKNIYENWPYLFKRKYFLQHANTLLGFDVEQKWKEELTLIVPKMMQLFRNISCDKKYCGLKDALKFVDEVNVTTQSKIAEEAYLVILLMKYFNEDNQNLFYYFERTASLQNILETFNTTAYPMIAVIGQNIYENPPAAVCIQGIAIGDITSMSDQVIIAFITYYVFNLCYPPEIEATMEFIERCILNVSTFGEGHKRSSKRKRTSVHPSVYKLAEKLERITSIWRTSSND